MTEPLCRLQVFLVSKELVGIEQRLVHSSMLTVEEVLKIIVTDLCDEVHTPVCQFSEQLLRRFILTIEVGVTKSCQHLVLTIERHPSPVSSNLREVSSPQCLPRLVDGLTADESVESRLVVVIPVLAVFQDGNHVFEPFLHLFLHCCIVIGSVCQSQGREVMAAHMTAEVETAAAPVLEVRVSGEPSVILACGESSLTDERCEQSVNIILQQ